MRVVYTGAEGFYKSTDGGKTFTVFRTPHGDNHDIWISRKTATSSSSRTTAERTSRSTAVARGRRS